MTTLWPHQQQAADFATYKPGTLLAMEMGTGKTLTDLHLLDLWQAKRVLILCPKSVCRVWQREFYKHTHGWEVVNLDSGRLTARTELLKAYYPMNLDRLAVIMNYEVLNDAPTAAALKRPWDCIIFDECHRLKSAAGVQSRRASQIMHHAARRLGLTGTPMPHSPLDVYAQCRCLDKRIFGASNAAFKARYAVKGGYMGHQIVDYQHLDELHDKLYTITYRCRAADVLDLPGAEDSYRYCDLGPAEAKAYKSMEQELVAEIAGGLVTASNALVKLLRLQQITSGYLPLEGDAQEIGTAKQGLLAEVLEDLSPAEVGEAREPVVVFCRYTHDLAAVAVVCAAQGLRCGELSGQRNDLEAWQRGEADVLATQLQAGGLGVDMTRARYCVYYSNSYSLGDYEQTRARCHRPGQTRPVTYIHLLARGTVDEVVLEALGKRRDVVAAVIDKLGKERK